MKICKNCFVDVEMQAAVCNESDTKGICEVCGQEGRLLDIGYFSDFFEEVLALFEPSETGTRIVDLVQQDWDIFSSVEIGTKVLSYFLSLKDYGYSVDDNVSYSALMEDKLNVWNVVKKQVRESRRFFADLLAFDEMNLMESNASILEGSIFYRARVIPSGVKELSTKEMSCPPNNKATAGRANPLGIPYLYLCQDEETTYYEVRALYLDRLSVAQFRVKENLDILDFTSKLSLYVAFSNATETLSDVIVKQKLLQAISHDLSKLLRRYDTELEYVPTQLICEYCKLNGIDGIRFESSLHKGGINLVLFDANKADCISVVSKEIKKVEIAL